MGVISNYFGPFFMQLVIVPFFVIGSGVFIAILIKKVLVAPIVTLLLNVSYEVWYSNYYYPHLEMSLTTWNIVLPVLSFLICWLIMFIRKLLK